MPKCCVTGCDNSRRGALLHRFPVNEIGLKKWLECLDEPFLWALNKEQLCRLWICNVHFEKKFVHVNKFRMRLSADAYPSLFTPEEYSTGMPSRSFEDKENVPVPKEHNYSRKRHYDHGYCKPKPANVQTPLVQQDDKGGEKILSEQIDIYSHNSSECATQLPARRPPLSSSNECPMVQPSTSNADINIVTNTSTSAATSTTLNSAASRKRHGWTPAQTHRRTRPINKIQNLTQAGRILHKEYLRAKSSANYFKRAKRALEFGRKTSFEDKMSKLNPYARKLIEIQLNLCGRKAKGRRFSLQEKLIGLSIMKQSPKCYRYLCKIFILPCISTLNKLTSQIKMETGINNEIFEVIKNEVANWSENKKFCSIIYDEMALETALSYDAKVDKINGFVELQERSEDFADHALVFMLRGAISKWQQPIAFYFCEGATKRHELKNIIREVVDAVVKTGLNPIALISDQGTSFVSTINSLLEDTRGQQIRDNKPTDNTIQLSGCKLNIIYDPPHLIKGIRNNFLNKNINFKGKIARWQDIIDVYLTDAHTANTRILHKLTDQHVIPSKIKKMKVSNCVKVLSASMVAALNYTSAFSHYVDGRPVSSTIKATADVVAFFDRLFDSVNGAALMGKNKKGKTMRTAVTETSLHHQFWKEAIQILKDIKYVHEDGRESTVPSLKNFIITLESLMRLWQFFQNKNIKIMRPRYFNSDVIENFFGQVRAYNYRSNNPDCHSFKCTFKSLLITRVMQFHSKSFNCQDDAADPIVNLQTLFKRSSVQRRPDNEEHVSNILDAARMQRLVQHSRAYTAGWVVRKILNIFKCNSCKKSFTTDEILPIHQWITQKEFNLIKKRSLCYPSDSAVRAFGDILTQTNDCLEIRGTENNICTVIKNIIKEESRQSLEFIDCPIHKSDIEDYFLNLTVRFAINNWCTYLNKILKGTVFERLRDVKNLPNMQAKAIFKYKKKLKNKSFNK